MVFGKYNATFYCNKGPHGEIVIKGRGRMPDVVVSGRNRQSTKNRLLTCPLWLDKKFGINPTIALLIFKQSSLEIITH